MLNRAQRRAGFITPDDLVNDALNSGYNYVYFDAANRLKPWRAQCGRGKTHGDSNGMHAGRWRGKRRATPREAAQDYCDYINNGDVLQIIRLKRAQHPKADKKAPFSDRYSELRAEIAEIEREAKKEALKRGETGWIYLVAETGNSTAFKLGKTWQNPPEARLRQLQTGNPRKLIMLAHKPGSEQGCDKDEKELHARYIKYNDYYGEWFSGCKEMFAEFGLGWPYIVGVVKGNQ